MQFFRCLKDDTILWFIILFVLLFVGGGCNGGSRSQNNGCGCGDNTLFGNNCGCGD